MHRGIMAVVIMVVVHGIWTRTRMCKGVVVVRMRETARAHCCHHHSMLLVIAQGGHHHCCHQDKGDGGRETEPEGDGKGMMSCQCHCCIVRVHCHVIVAR